jgi:hypothetical protein
VFDRTIPIYRQERHFVTTEPKDPTPIYTETVKDHPELFGAKPTEAVEEVHVGEPADEAHVR